MASDGIPGLVEDLAQGRVSRRQFLVGALALGVSLSSASSILAACGSGSSGGGASASPSAGLGSSYDVSKAGDVTLKLLWLGDQEEPGQQKWMKWVVEQYQAKYPNVTVQTVLSTEGGYLEAQTAAGKAHQGPDIWYNWGGTWSMEPAWNGYTLPLEKVVSSADLDRIVDRGATEWNNQHWLYSQWRRNYPMMFNKALFTKAGLDPNTPPTTWPEFLTVLKALQAHGITPIIVGLKIGAAYGAENVAIAFQKQVVDSVQTFIQMSATGSWNTPVWKQWLTALQQISPYVAKESQSVDIYQALDIFRNGKAAMMFGLPGWPSAVRYLGADGGIFLTPVFGSGKLASSLPIDCPGWQVTSWSAHPLVAGHFLAFTSTAAVSNQLYTDCGVIPGSTAWNHVVSNPIDKQLDIWLQAKPCFYPANYYPTPIDVNSNATAISGITSGRVTVDQAAQSYQTQIEIWRKADPQDVQFYSQWATTGGF